MQVAIFLGIAALSLVLLLLCSVLTTLLQEVRRLDRRIDGVESRCSDKRAQQPPQEDIE